VREVECLEPAQMTPLILATSAARRVPQR
jgi:hypothetical protein